MPFSVLTHPFFPHLHRSLKQYGELPETAKLNETDGTGEEGEDGGVEFAEGSEDEESDDDLDDL